MPTPANLVHQTSSSTGTGNLSLVAVNGKQSFNSAFSTGGTDVFDYFISNQDASEWERGTGHLSDATTLVRDTVLESTNSNNAVNFSAGIKDVTNDVPAGKQVTTEGEVAFTSYLDFEERTDPSNPPADTMRAYARDDGAGNTEMVLLDSAGNEHIISSRQRAWTDVAEVSASGTSFNLAMGLPDDVEEIEIQLRNISTDGTDDVPIVQLGDSGGFETSGYTSISHRTDSNNTINTTTTGFLWGYQIDSGEQHSGKFRLSRYNGDNARWGADAIATDDGEFTAVAYGHKDLSAALSQLRMTTVAGTSSFDGGTVQVRYR